jgi:hypothetical protein
MSGHDANIRTGPDETIQFGDDDPASFSVEPKLSLYVAGNLDCVRRAFWFRVGNGGDKQLSSAFSHDGSHNHDSGAVLASGLLAPIGLVRPKIDVGDNLSRLRDP